MKVGIVGYGWVGRAAHLLFPNAAIHDINIEQYQDPLPECDIVFLAVPTPWDGERLDCSAVEAAIAACSSSLIVIRSATQPGFADAMAEKYRKRIVVQPEYLGESPNHPMLAMKERQFMILGGNPQDRRQVIDCYATVYNANVTIRQVTNLEAEIIKLTENRAIFWKVLQCQELYDACEAAGVDYYTIRDAVYGDDPRMNLWWTFVYPDNRGANSKCLPKDVYAWAAWAESTGIDCSATESLLRYNDNIINPAEITVLTFKWKKPVSGHKLKNPVEYTSEHVNVLWRSIQRNTTKKFRFVCITDNPEGLDSGIEHYPLWDHCLDLGGCYNRMWVFSDTIKELFGSRLLYIDLDCVIVNNIDHLISRSEDFVINRFIGDDKFSQVYNGGLVLMTAGSKSEIWNMFDSLTTPTLIDQHRKQYGLVGSDQAWIQMLLGTGEATFGPEHGVYDYSHLQDHQLPDNACVVLFPGAKDPSILRQQVAWIDQHWR